MKYSDGREVRVGDKVRLWEGCYGLVVCSLDTHEFSKEYPKNNWDYLKSGVVIDSDRAGLIHYLESNEDLEFLERKSDTIDKE